MDCQEMTAEISITCYAGTQRQHEEPNPDPQRKLLRIKENQSVETEPFTPEQRWDEGIEGRETSPFSSDRTTPIYRGGGASISRDSTPNDSANRWSAETALLYSRPGMAVYHDGMFSKTVPSQGHEKNNEVGLTPITSEYTDDGLTEAETSTSTVAPGEDVTMQEDGMHSAETIVCGAERQDLEQKYEAQSREVSMLQQTVSTLEHAMAEKDAVIQKLQDAVQDKDQRILKLMTGSHQSDYGDLDDAIARIWKSLGYHVRNVVENRFLGHPFVKKVQNDQRHLFEQVSPRWRKFLTDETFKGSFIEGAIWAKLVSEILGKPEIVFHQAMGEAIADVRARATEVYRKQLDAEEGQERVQSRETIEQFRAWRAKTGRLLQYLAGDPSINAKWHFNPARCQNLASEMTSIFSIHSSVQQNVHQLQRQFMAIVELAVDLSRLLACADAEYMVTPCGNRGFPGETCFRFSPSNMEIALDTTDDVGDPTGYGEFAIRPALVRFGNREGKEIGRFTVCKGEVCL